MQAKWIAQEMSRFNRLLSQMSLTLKQLQKAACRSATP